MVKDIQTRQDIELLVDQFYKQLVVDEQIGFFFTQVVTLDWDIHIPIMYDFWETTLLGKRSYRGNPMLKHMILDQKTPLKKVHFTRWLSIWEKTIVQNFSGETADEAIKRAKHIGELMQFKINANRKQ